MIVSRRLLSALPILAACVFSTGCTSGNSGTAVVPPSGATTQQLVRSTVSVTATADAEYDPTPVINFAPQNGPLAMPNFDSQAASAGLNDVAKTYAADAKNNVTNTGVRTLGSLQTQTTFVNTCVVAKFVAGTNGAPYINTRIVNGRSIGMFWSGGAAEVFDNFSTWTVIGGVNMTLTPGQEYYAKLDVQQTSATATTIHATFLNLDGSVVASKTMTDSIAASQNVRGLDDVEESPGGITIGRVMAFHGAQPNSIVVTGPVQTPGPSASPTGVPTAGPTSTPTAHPSASPTPAPTPTPVKPSPTPYPTPTAPGSVAQSLCIGQPNGTGLTYNLVSHDEFDHDAALNTGYPIAGDLNVSDTYSPPFVASTKQTTWSNSFSFGHTNPGLSGTDDSAYPTFADISTWQKEYGASKYPDTIKLVPGVGVQLAAYPVPQPVPSDVHAFLCADGTCRHNLGGLMDGNINNAYQFGYWVYSAEVPDGRSSAPGFWPSDWTLCETSCSPTNNNYYEMDTFEVFGSLLGQGGFHQTLQAENPDASTGQTTGPGPITGNQLAAEQNSTIQTQFHTYAEISTPTYVGFYFDNVARSGRLNQVPAANNASNPGVSPIMEMQTCSASSYCAPGVGPTQAEGVMMEQYYRHYAPSTVSCGPPYDVPAQGSTATYEAPPTELKNS